LSPECWEAYRAWWNAIRAWWSANFWGVVFKISRIKIVFEKMGLFYSWGDWRIYVVLG